MQNKNDKDIISYFGLSEHPEGGWYRKNFESTDSVRLKRGDRFCGSVIYYYLGLGEKSCLHYLNSDETWYFHFGSPVILHLFSSSEYQSVILGNNWQKGEYVQYTINREVVFGAELIKNQGALLSCSVCPGYSDDDFHWPSKDALLYQFPENHSIIERLSNHK